jgi:hypothetical protein
LVDIAVANNAALISGHGAATSGQVVLGSDTLAQLHKHLGDTVVVSTIGGTTVGSRHLRIVGTATLPAFGNAPHLEMATGAVLDYRLIPANSRNQFDNPDAGPQAALVRLRPGANPPAAYASLAKIAQETTTPQNFGVAVIGVQRPAGPSTTSVTIGVVAGVPLGIALGRWLWDLFAADIGAVPAPSVPVVEVVLIAVGALVLANVVAAIPARLPARTPTALVLRAE